MEVTKLSQGRQNTQDLSLNNLDNNAGSTVNENGDKFVILFPEGNSDGVSPAGIKKADENDIKKAVETANKILKENNTHVEYEVHDKFKNDIIIKIVDNETHKVIKEIPPKKILDMVAGFCEIDGVLLDQKA